MSKQVPTLSEGLAPCPVCGGMPILGRHIFRVRSAGKHMTAYGNMVYSYRNEPRAYLHCPCDHCVTDWKPAVRNGIGYEFGSEVRAAEAAWRNREWVTIDEEDDDGE